MTDTSPLPKAVSAGFTNASSYERYRPSYPVEAVLKLFEGLKLSGLSGAQVVDLAAGTGKFTELLAARKEGFEITAIEPHEGMRQELERKKLSNVRTIDGTAAKMPLETQSVDALIAAQVR